MSLDFGGTKITRVEIVDDKADVRRIMAISVGEADLEPVVEDRPLPPLDEFVSAAMARADGAICDHRLNLGKYAQFSGAEAVAKFYEMNWPAFLCTTWSKADIDGMRVHRRRIPVLIHTDELNPDNIVKGFEYCIRELKSDFSPSRRPWRTLVRVEDVDKQLKPPMFYVVLPGWYSSDKISLPLDLVPSKLRQKIKPGVRFHAQVNKGAENQDDLYFESFEFD